MIKLPKILQILVSTNKIDISHCTSLNLLLIELQNFKALTIFNIKYYKYSIFFSQKLNNFISLSNKVYFCF